MTYKTTINAPEIPPPHCKRHIKGIPPFWTGEVFSLLLKIIRLRILYWNSLRLVSSVVSKLKENNFFQSLLSLGALYTNTLNQIDLMVWRPFQSYISFKSPPSPLYYPLYVVGRIYHTSHTPSFQLARFLLSPNARQGNCMGCWQFVIWIWMCVNHV